MRINYMLVNVEAAYWNLYAAYYNLYAQEEGLRQAFEGLPVHRRSGSRPATTRRRTTDQVQAQFHRFRRRSIRPAGRCWRAERQSARPARPAERRRHAHRADRQAERGRRSSPTSTTRPTTALANRPELMHAAAGPEGPAIQPAAAEEPPPAGPPDVRAVRHRRPRHAARRRRSSPNAAGTIPGNALASFGNNQFNSWTIGLRMDMPIGFRDANAPVREAQMNLARSYFSAARRRDEDPGVPASVQYRRVIQAHAVIAPAASRTRGPADLSRQGQGGHRHRQLGAGVLIRTT